MGTAGARPPSLAKPTRGSISTAKKRPLTPSAQMRTTTAKRPKRSLPFADSSSSGDDDSPPPVVPTKRLNLGRLKQVIQNKGLQGNPSQSQAPKAIIQNQAKGSAGLEEGIKKDRNAPAQTLARLKVPPAGRDEQRSHHLGSSVNNGAIGYKEPLGGKSGSDKAGGRPTEMKMALASKATNKARLATTNTGAAMQARRDGNQGQGQDTLHTMRPPSTNISQNQQRNMVSVNAVGLSGSQHRVNPMVGNPAKKPQSSVQTGPGEKRKTGDVPLRPDTRTAPKKKLEVTSTTSTTPQRTTQPPLKGQAAQGVAPKLLNPPTAVKPGPRNNTFASTAAERSRNSMAAAPTRKSSPSHLTMSSAKADRSSIPTVIDASGAIPRQSSSTAEASGAKNDRHHNVPASGSATQKEVPANIPPRSALPRAKSDALAALKALPTNQNANSDASRPVINNPTGAPVDNSADALSKGARAITDASAASNVATTKQNASPYVSKPAPNKPKGATAIDSAGDGITKGVRDSLSSTKADLARPVTNTIAPKTFATSQDAISATRVVPTKPKANQAFRGVGSNVPKASITIRDSCPINPSANTSTANIPTEAIEPAEYSPKSSRAMNETSSPPKKDASATVWNSSSTTSEDPSTGPSANATESDATKATDRVETPPKSAPERPATIRIQPNAVSANREEAAAQQPSNAGKSVEETTNLHAPLSEDPLKLDVRAPSAAETCILRQDTYPEASSAKSGPEIKASAPSTPSVSKQRPHTTSSEAPSSTPPAQIATQGFQPGNSNKDHPAPEAQEKVHSPPSDGSATTPKFASVELGEPKDNEEVATAASMKFDAVLDIPKPALATHEKPDSTSGLLKDAAPKETVSLPGKTMTSPEETIFNSGDLRIVANYPSAISQSVDDTADLPVVTLPDLSKLFQSEPYFEYTVSENRWSESDKENDTPAPVTVRRAFTSVDDANDAAEKLCAHAKQQYTSLFQVKFQAWSIQRNDHDCMSYLGTFAPMHYPSKKAYLRIWVDRHYVSAHAAAIQAPPPHTPFIQKTLYILRLHKLIPDPNASSPVPSDSDSSSGSSSDSSSESESEDRAAKAARKDEARAKRKADEKQAKAAKRQQSPHPMPLLRQHHPLPCTELYTTLDGANHAARRLQIEMSHEANPSAANARWQEQDARNLLTKARSLDPSVGGEEGYWRSEFNASGRGGDRFELVVEKAGLCGPRNL